ncbi:MAG: glycosyltransferase [Bacteroidota bacterium]|nr:glycosyltransferase [Bacteroidota bacterium]
MDYSLVIPVYNSSKTLRELYLQLSEVMAKMADRYEIIFVDDCSGDDSLKVLRSIKTGDKNVRILAMQNNAGQNIATLCGIEHTRYDAVITMDDDLQYSPGDILKLAAVFNKGKYIIVYGNPEVRTPEARFKILPAVARWAFNQVILRSHRKVKYFLSYRMFSKSKMAAVMPKGLNIYFVWEIPAEKMGNVNVGHNPSQRGVSNYNIARLFLFFSQYIWFSLFRFSNAMIALSVLFAVFTIVKVSGHIPDAKFLIIIPLVAFMLSMGVYFFSRLQVEGKRKPQFKSVEV